MKEGRLKEEKNMKKNIDVKKSYVNGGRMKIRVKKLRTFKNKQKGRENENDAV